MTIIQAYTILRFAYSHIFHKINPPMDIIKQERKTKVYGLAYIL